MIDKILEKLFSGRWFATVCVTLTYCFIVIYATMKYTSSLTRVPDKLEAFAMGLIVGFSSLAGIVLKSYFEKNKQ